MSREVDHPQALDPDRLARRRERELEVYRSQEEVHNLPPIFHFWSHRFVLPKLEACGFASRDDFFLHYITRQCARAGQGPHAIASLGAGNCDFELLLASKLVERGVDNFEFHCLEFNPAMLERGEAAVREAGLENHFRLRETDVEVWQPDRSYSVCIAHHALHHFVELERIFTAVERAIGSEGVLLVADMIGRNGHMRWPESLEVIERLWREMPDRYKYNHQLRRFEARYENWDCSTESNEGVRAQDILPLLLERFEFHAFVPFGGIIDIFVDRSFGHNFDLERAEDREWIARVAELNDAYVDRGKIKPTQLFAALGAAPAERPRYFGDWTPSFCVRWPEGSFPATPPLA